MTINSKIDTEYDTFVSYKTWKKYLMQILIYWISEQKLDSWRNFNSQDSVRIRALYCINIKRVSLILPVDIKFKILCLLG